MCSKQVHLIFFTIFDVGNIKNGKVFIYFIHHMLFFYLIAKVRNYVVCHDCGKRRVVYSAAKLTREQETAVTRVKEELLYSCGNPLFPGGAYQDIIIVKEGMNCQSPMETTYYSGTHFN